jgi:hypothetical protein
VFEAENLEARLEGRNLRGKKEEVIVEDLVRNSRLGSRKGIYAEEKRLVSSRRPVGESVGR